MIKLRQLSARWVRTLPEWSSGILLPLCLVGVLAVFFLPSGWSHPSSRDSLSYPVFIEEDLNQSLMTLRVVALSGSQKDPQGRMGLMAYTGRGILRGTVTRPYSELQALFSQLGVEASMTPSWNQLEWTFRFPSESLSAVADLLEDLFTQPRFDARDMNEVQLQMRAELRGQFTQKQFIGEWGGANGSLVSGPFSTSPLGTMEGIGRLTPQEAQRAFTSEIHRGNLVVGVLGSVPSDVVLAVLGSRLFFSLPASVLLSRPHQVREPMLRRGVLLDSSPTSPSDSVGLTFFVPDSPFYV
jgi:predicted Zn-dependent peptidase